MMPSVPEALFLRGIEETVRANAAGAAPRERREPLHPSFFDRGWGKLRLRPAPRYEFRVFVSPVGPYYKGED